MPSSWFDNRARDANLIASAIRAVDDSGQNFTMDETLQVHGGDIPSGQMSQFKGTATGAVIGALLLESLNNGMGLMNVESSFQMIVNGLVLLVAVYFDLRGRRAQRE